jgi:N-acetylglucosaminyldiphosphoundecaprenol N-acetyl-beta-D-mannosaminyltransferase
VPAPTVTILDVDIHRVTTAAMLDQIQQWVALRREQGTPCRQIATVNPEFVVDAHRDPVFAAALTRADLRVADGVGILWAARRQGVRLAERVTGSDGIYAIAAQAAAAGWRLYFLGAAPGVAERTAAILQARYPGLIVAGSYAGSPAEEEWPALRERLAAARPDVLLVAYGHPRQDLWIDRHRNELPAAVAIGVGGAFDFVAGVAQRAPVWMRRVGLEWLFRLVREPWRWRRMAKLPVFAWWVVRGRA